MSRTIRIISSAAAFLVGVAGLFLILYAWRLIPFFGGNEMTENAYVRGQVTIMAPQVAGFISAVNVKDFQRVKAGDVLAEIDERSYEQKVRQAESTLRTQKAQVESLEQKRKSAEAKLRAGKSQIAGAEAALRAAEATYERNKSLVGRSVVSVSAIEQSLSALEQARAAVAQAVSNQEVLEQDVASIEVSRESYLASVDAAKAALELARIDLANTRIVAPTDGRLGEVGARKGAYVAVGTQLMTVVPDRIWVTANFKETQLAAIEVGQQVIFTVDALDHRKFRGRVESLAPATGNEFSVIKADNATGNFTKIAQRLPVRIAIDQGQAGEEKLVPGMSVVVAIPPSDRSQTAEVLQQHLEDPNT